MLGPKRVETQQESRLSVALTSNEMELFLQWQVNPFNMRQLRV